MLIALEICFSPLCIPALIIILLMIVEYLQMFNSFNFLQSSHLGSHTVVSQFCQAMITCVNVSVAMSSSQPMV